MSKTTGDDAGMDVNTEANAAKRAPKCLKIRNICTIVAACREFIDGHVEIQVK